ncbi:MAG: TetR/AcrR family transcriptional regulator [Parasphingorhabdus sp.]|jgi:TetR/AcrR family transcriptional regulator
MTESPSDSIRERNQKKILIAAEFEFEQHGFGGARMQSIADRAELPKANIHYYYKNKKELYIAVLSGITQLWNDAFDRISPDDDPASALETYIRAKLAYSQSNPVGARIFSNEIIHGAPHLQDYLNTDLRSWVAERATVIQSWIDRGLIIAVDPYHLIFLIWSATQHYADYYSQIIAIQGKTSLSNEDFQSIGDSLVRFILTGCGLSNKPG